MDLFNANSYLAFLAVQLACKWLSEIMETVMSSPELHEENFVSISITENQLIAKIMS